MNQPYFMQTARLGFRRWRQDDLNLALGLWGDIRVTRLIDARGQLSAAQVQERLAAEIASQREYGLQYWPIFLLESDEHVGCCGLRPYDPPTRHPGSIYEIGVHIRSDHWRRGYAYEAAAAVIDYAFDDLQAAGLFAGHNPQNEASRHLLARLGFCYTHDEYYPPTGLDHPSYMLAAAEHARRGRVSAYRQGQRMDDKLKADPVIRRLIQWATDNPAVRAMLLTSTRTNPTAPVDLLSDYDVILAVDDVRPFYESRAWLSDFGPFLLLYRDPLKLTYGLEGFAYITQYEDGLKIDFTLWTAGILPRIAAGPGLPDELDVGYVLLLDKDNLAEGLQPPTYQAHIPAPPAEDQYLEAVELFFHETTYFAKYLWRDDLVAAKHIFDSIKVGNLRQMLEWLIEIDHGWSLKPGAYGRYLKRYLRPALWTQLEETYVGPGLEENWQALFKTAALFRQAAEEVGQRLGFVYPAELDRRAMGYLQWVRGLDRQAGPLALERRARAVKAGRLEPLLDHPT